MPETVHLGAKDGIQPGALLGDKYRLDRLVGRGAMGEVWLATHVTLKQKVAIKLILAEYARVAEARARFAREAKAAARLRSQHVVRVYDDGETPWGAPYIVMEYLEGETLEQRLERERRVPLDEAVLITSHVARALTSAHAQGIVHRDLKPANIHLTRSDDDPHGFIAKVLDFGIAKVLTDQPGPTTSTGMLLGTPLFMSPEQVRAQAVDHRSDLYSLGMCFFNMVAGRPAFEGASFTEVALAVLSEPLPEIRTAAEGLPPGVAGWFLRCCAREPQARFQSAAELVQELTQAIRASPIAGGAARAGPTGTLHAHAEPRPADTAPLGGMPDPARPIEPMPPTAALVPTSTAPDPSTLQIPLRRSRPLLLLGLFLMAVLGYVAARVVGSPATETETAPASASPPPTLEPAPPTRAEEPIPIPKKPEPEPEPAPTSATSPPAPRAAPRPAPRPAANGPNPKPRGNPTDLGF